TVISANTTPTRATAEPTERSKLRVTMSITALIAARLTIDVWRARRTRLRCVRKVPFVATYSEIQITRRTMSSVDSRRDFCPNGPARPDAAFVLGGFAAADGASDGVSGRIVRLRR